MKFRNGKKMKRLNLRTYILLIAAVVAVLLIAGIVMIRKVYTDNLKPVSTVKKSHVITIEPGTPTPTIADTLYSKGAIRSDWAFEWYVRNHQLNDQIKAGTYLVDETQSVQEIVSLLIDGKIRSDLVTIL